MQYVRQKPLASTFFKARGGPATVFGAIPRYKYMFYANFVASQAALNRYPDYYRLGSWETGVSFKIHTVDKPQIELNVQELNQYNRKRYAYTKINYHPFTIRLYDTVDNIPLEMWRRYFTFYFGDSRTKGTSATGATTVYNQMVTDPNFAYDTGWGLNPRDEHYNFFDRVEVYAIYGGYYTQINYINPKITRVDWQQYDSSSSEMADLQMTLSYEAIEYLPSTPITAIQLAQFGFDIEAATEVPGVPVPNQDITSSIYSTLGGLQSTLLPTDLASSINSAFQIANTTLNLFNNSPLGIISPTAGKIVGQTTQGVQAANTLFGLTTNPSIPSNYLGTGYSFINSYNTSASSTLSPYGSFNFGRL